MMYQTYDLYSRSTEVMNSFISMSQQLVCHPSNPFTNTLVGQSVKAALESAFRHTKKYEKLSFDIKSTIRDGQTVDINEEIVYSKPFCNLLHFKADTDIVKPRLLLVAALSGHHATLLRDTVKRLVSDHDVFVTDWLDAKDIPLSDGRFGFDEYVSYIIEFMEDLGTNTHVLAVCQPAVQALVATAVMAKAKNPCAPKSLTLMAGPIDTSINPNKVDSYASSKDINFFKNNVISTVPNRFPGAGRQVYPGFLQLTSFISMNVGDHVKKHLNYFDDVFHGRADKAEHHRKFYDEYMAVLDLSADFFIETLERVFIDQHLAKGKMTYHGELVDLGDICNTPLHTIEGEKDDICSIGQTQAAQTLCVSLPDALKQNDVFDVGHYGSFSGSTFRNTIAPCITDFINKHNG